MGDYRIIVRKNGCDYSCGGIKYNWYFVLLSGTNFGGDDGISNHNTNSRKMEYINGTELVDLILKYYEDLSEKYRKMIPLKMVYIPVPKEE